MTKTLARAHWLELQLLSLLLLYFRALSVYAQPGYISIDCGSGSRKNYTEESTGIIWNNDDAYIISGYNSGPILTLQGDWANQFSNFRYFNESQSKFCYELSVDVNKTYLVRAGFLWGNFTDLSEGNISFDLTISSTLWKTVEISRVRSLRSDFEDGYTVPLTTETIVRSTSSLVNVCLVRKTGFPFISSLELRPLDDDMYVEVLKSKTLVSQWRWTAGPCCSVGLSPQYRYPVDPYDRIWYLYPDVLTSGNSLVEDKVVIENFDGNRDYLENQTVVAPMMSGFNRPPVEVMMDAWAFNGSVVMHMPVDGKSSEYYIALYFQELNGTSGVRRFNLSLNGELLEEVFPQANGSAFIAVKKISGTYANFTLQIPRGSSLNPIVNALEMYGVLDANSSTTDPDDVRSLNAIRARLGLPDWTGDPCFPVPWEWLSCNDIQPSRVTQVKLTNFGLGGSIPLELGGLRELTDLWLDSNSFRGLIPNFTSLQKIKTIHLQNNLLSGAIPPNLSELPVLQELFLDNNSFSGEVPQSLLALASSEGRNFTFTFSGNLLCLPGNTTCEGNSPGGAPAASNSSRVKMGVIVGPVISAIAVLMAIIAALLIYRRRASYDKTDQTPISARKKDYTAQPLGLGQLQANQARPYTYEEVERITSNFQKVLGAGSFGPVYYGMLPSGQEVAVKVNAVNSKQGAAEFGNEVVLLSRVHHKYLVSLVGYCEESNHQILIYVYMPNGSLGDHLHGKNPLSWKKRLEIALNAAQGLDYLHTFCSPPIVHRDVKPSNILLDENLNAKVADFGMSKSEFEGSQTGISTAVKGTFGYLDPEYSSGWQRLSQKSDVYSFGVVLLELITGKKPTAAQLLEDGTELLMIEWTRLATTLGDLNGIIDPTILDKHYNLEAVWKVAELAWASVNPRGADRPDMGQIVQGLNEAIQMERATGIEKVGKTKPKLVRFDSKVVENDGDGKALTDSTEAPLRTHSMDTTATWDYENSSAYHPR